MRVVKVFNNNVVWAVDEQGHDLVLSGRGLGYRVHSGEEVDQAKVERTFAPTSSATVDRIAALVGELAPEDIELTERVVQAARTALGPHVTDRVLLPMADHISFALRRAGSGTAEVEYPLRWEVQYLYPAEIAVAEQALDLIERERGIRLPDVEAVPLALHLVNAQFGATDLTTTLQMTKILHEILGVITEDLDVEVDERSVEVARFVTHLRYLFVRQQQGRKLGEQSDALHEALRSARPREYTSAGRIGALLAERFGWTITTDEMLYLTLHVSRLTDTVGEGRQVHRADGGSPDGKGDLA